MGIPQQIVSTVTSENQWKPSPCLHPSEGASYSCYAPLSTVHSISIVLDLESPRLIRTFQCAPIASAMGSTSHLFNCVKSHSTAITTCFSDIMPPTLDVCHGDPNTPPYTRAIVCPPPAVHSLSVVVESTHRARPWTGSMLKTRSKSSNISSFSRTSVTSVRRLFHTIIAHGMRGRAYGPAVPHALDAIMRGRCFCYARPLSSISCCRFSTRVHVLLQLSRSATANSPFAPSLREPALEHAAIDRVDGDFDDCKSDRCARPQWLAACELGRSGWGVGGCSAWR